MNDSNIRPDWLPEGKRAAVCFTIDDVHPGRSCDQYEAGGDLGQGAMRHVERLLRLHPELQVTMFTTADWRETRAVPTRKLLARIPWLRDRIYLAPLLPAGTMSLDRHPEFVSYLSNLPRTEIALHGLHHVHRGLRIPVEFQQETPEECARILRAALAIFERAGLRCVSGINPPGWDMPPALTQAIVELGFIFVSSARDVRTPITPEAKTNMSGLSGVSLLYPELICDGRLLHMSSNFQATSCGGLLAIKAHIVKVAYGYTQIDGLDDLYTNYLDLVFSEMHRRYGESLWWTSMGQIAERVFSRNEGAAQL
jgi:hypothetical protein